MSAVCIIPARSGSRRIEHKNRKFFHGKPIIQYSIDAAKQSGLFERIYVSTDDSQIMELISGQELFLHLRSSQYLCGDVAGTQEVALDCLLNSTSGSFDYACVIYPCAPMMTVEDLKLGFRALTDPRAQTDFAYSVGMNPFRDAGNWYWGKTQSFLDGVPLDPDGFNIMKVVIPNERVCDINTPEDWSRAEAMYAALHPEVA